MQPLVNAAVGLIRLDEKRQPETEVTSCISFLSFMCGHTGQRASEQESALNHFKGNAAVKPEASLALVRNAGAQRRVRQVDIERQQEPKLAGSALFISRQNTRTQIYPRGKASYTDRH